MLTKDAEADLATLLWRGYGLLQHDVSVAGVEIICFAEPLDVRTLVELIRMNLTVVQGYAAMKGATVKLVGALQIIRI